MEKLELSKNNSAVEEVNFHQKIIVIGDGACGKSSQIKRYIKNEFEEGSKPTIGVEFNTKLVKVDGNVCKLQIWDTAGQERFRGIVSSYYKGAKGVFLCYDITRLDTFANLERWNDEIDKNSSGSVIKVVIGMKKDLASQRRVSIEQAIEWARKNDMMFFETSSLDNSGKEIQRAFREMVSEITKFISTTSFRNIEKNKSVLEQKNSQRSSTKKKKKKQADCNC